jgi:hypothetical protein
LFTPKCPRRSISFVLLFLGLTGCCTEVFGRTAGCLAPTDGPKQMGPECPSTGHGELPFALLDVTYRLKLNACRKPCQIKEAVTLHDGRPAPLCLRLATVFLNRTERQHFPFLPSTQYRRSTGPLNSTLPWTRHSLDRCE